MTSGRCPYYFGNPYATVSEKLVNMQRLGNLKKLGPASVGFFAILIGFALPAYAEGNRTTYMSGYKDGDESRQWVDRNTDGTDTRAVFFFRCTREFRAYIYREDAGPDTNMGSEWIDCQSYDDAVRVGDVPADEYHFTITGLGSVCFSGQCTPNRTDVDPVKIYW